jgi:CRISPR/Cas system CSM-associated protein Csm5 (group 7 of RAMP superfamily)
MNMKGINQTVKLGLEILTPTQAGSGEELFKELDYIDRAGDAFVVNQVQSFNAVASGNLALDTLLASGSLSDLVKAAGQDFGYRLPWLSAKQKIPDKFREQVKDAFNHPYLPGTALKGAIRTALIAEWLRSAMQLEDISKHIDSLLPKRDRHGKAPRSKSAANGLMEALTGKDAKQDIFRPLRTKDALFNASDLSLADIRWLNERRWRSMSQRKSFDDWKVADGICVEVLQPGSLTLTTLQWDGFLLSDSCWQQSGTVANILPKDFAGLKEQLNKHAKYRLNREIDFYQSQGKQQPKDECQRILTQLENDQDAAYLQLSWGSGWRGMTGDWASEDQVKLFRELFGLGRTGKPFPKTRRLAVSGEPKLPLGWIRLSPHEMVADRLEKQLAQQQATANKSQWVTQKIAQIAGQNRSSEKDALRGKALAEAWQALSEGEEKKLALADIKNRWLAENWWDEPNGKSARQAKAIYEYL